LPLNTPLRQRLGGRPKANPLEGENMESNLYFGYYRNLPECDSCMVGDDCLSMTLGRMTERGLLIEKFDPDRGELVYSISEKGKRRLEQASLTARK